MSRLPNGYQEVEYIESTGTQWIDTGVYANSLTTGFEMTFLGKNNLTTTDGSFGTIFGGRQSSSSMQFDMSTYNGSKSSGVFEVGNRTQVALDYTKNVKLTCSYKNAVFTSCTGTATTLTPANTTSPMSVSLFAMHQRGTTLYYECGSLQLYSYKMYEGNTLIRNFVPCYRISDNVIGLYDTVNDVFYDNDGTGTFTKGENVVGVLYNTLITDRTQADVDLVKTLKAKGLSGMNASELAQWNAGLKGAYNYTDLNRVGSCILDLKNRCVDLGISFTTAETAYFTAIKTDWALGNIPIATQLANIRTAINTLREKLDVGSSQLLPNTPGTYANLTYSSANDIEKILLILDVMMQSMANNPICGVAVCGTQGELI